MKSRVGQMEFRSLHHGRTDEEQVEVDAPIVAPCPDRRAAHGLLDPLPLPPPPPRGPRRPCPAHPYIRSFTLHGREISTPPASNAPGRGGAGLLARMRTPAAGKRSSNAVANRSASASNSRYCSLSPISFTRRNTSA